MKYSININQKRLVEEAPKLDIKDAVILDYLKEFCSNPDPKIKRITINEETLTHFYTWINFNHLIDELPLLKFNQKASISDRLKKIEKAGFIKRFQAPDNSLYVRLTEKIQDLAWDQRYSFKLTAVSQNLQAGVSLNEQHKHNIKSNISSEPKGSVESLDPVHAVFDFFFTACLNLKGFKPHFTGEQEGRMIKDKLQQYSLDEITDEIDWFLKSPESDRLSPSLSVAFSAGVWNKWLNCREK